MIDNKQKVSLSKELFGEDYLYLAFFLFCAVLLSGYFLLIRPKVSELRTAYSLLNQKSQEFETEKNYAQQLDGLQKDFAAVDPNNIEKLNKAIPEKDDFNDGVLMKQLESLVLQNGLVLTSLQISKAELVGSINSEAISLMISGVDYESLRKFLASLEDNLNIFDVEKINFDPSAKSLSLVIRTYYR